MKVDNRSESEDLLCLFIFEGEKFEYFTKQQQQQSQQKAESCVLPS